MIDIYRDDGSKLYMTPSSLAEYRKQESHEPEVVHVNLYGSEIIAWLRCYGLWSWCVIVGTLEIDNE
jgi:hypothetical protein